MARKATSEQTRPTLTQFDDSYDLGSAWESNLSYVCLSYNLSGEDLAPRFNTHAKLSQQVADVVSEWMESQGRGSEPFRSLFPNCPAPVIWVGCHLAEDEWPEHIAAFKAAMCSVLTEFHRELKSVERKYDSFSISAKF